jgi:predicted enzyme related to lactoylglutathione lyase
MAVRTLKRGKAGAARKPAPAKRAPAKTRPAAKRAAARPVKPARGASAKLPRGPKPSANGAAKPVANAPSYPSAIGLVKQHMDYTTHDIESVKRFYTETLGLSRFRYLPDHQYLAVETGPSSSLGFMPPVPGPPERWRPPREPNLYLEVEDVDHAYRELTARGVTFEQEPADMPWGHRVALLRDPEGRMICLAQIRHAAKGV